MFLLTVMFSLVNTHTAERKVTVSIDGLTETFTVACLSMVVSKVKEHGRSLHQSRTQTCTRESIKMI